MIGKVTIPNLKIGVFHQIQSSEETAIQKVLRLCNLEQVDEVAKIYIFYYNNTVDEQWVEKAIQGFNPSKIKYIHQNELIGSL